MYVSRVVKLLYIPNNFHISYLNHVSDPSRGLYLGAPVTEYVCERERPIDSGK